MEGNFIRTAFCGIFKAWNVKGSVFFLVASDCYSRARSQPFSSFSLTADDTTLNYLDRVIQ